MPKDVAVSVRRRLNASILDQKGSPRVRLERGILSYVVEVKTVAERVYRDLARYCDAMQLIVEDDEVRGRAAIFRGTRILVHQIADLTEQGAAPQIRREGRLGSRHKQCRQVSTPLPPYRNPPWRAFPGSLCPWLGSGQTLRGTARALPRGPLPFQSPYPARSTGGGAAGCVSRGGRGRCPVPWRYASASRPTRGQHRLRRSPGRCRDGSGPKPR